MSAVESLDPNPRRLPRKNDRVVAAPKAPGCVSGTVLAYSSRSLSIETTGPAGKVHMEMSRFTWCNKRRAWVCWPKDVLTAIKKLDQDESRLMLMTDFAFLGAFVLFEGRVAWVKRHVTQPVPIERARAIGSHLKAYVLCTPEGERTIERDGLTYDSRRRMWIGREGLNA